jgi:hypothetical protein
LKMGIVLKLKYSNLDDGIIWIYGQPHQRNFSTFFIKNYSYLKTVFYFIFRNQFFITLIFIFQFIKWKKVEWKKWKLIKTEMHSVN